jgi:hypothetical protein
MLPKSMKSLFLFGMLLTGLWGGADAGVAAAPEIGEQAPDFTLPSTTGQDISPSQFRGKKFVLLEFYGVDFAPV